MDLYRFIMNTCYLYNLKNSFTEQEESYQFESNHIRVKPEDVDTKKNEIRAELFSSLIAKLDACLFVTEMEDGFIDFQIKI